MWQFLGIVESLASLLNVYETYCQNESDFSCALSDKTHVLTEINNHFVQILIKEEK